MPVIILSVVGRSLEVLHSDSTPGVSKSLAAEIVLDPARHLKLARSSQSSSRK